MEPPMTAPTLRPSTPSLWLKLLPVFALVFGIITIISGGGVLFGPADLQAKAGDFVGFVVWFNFIAGWFYVVTAIGLWLGKAWAARLAAFIAISTALVALGFGIAVLRGTPYELRTVGALMLRFSVWAAIALVAKRAGQST
ncbi:hypothetical protein MWU76_17855 [Gelidibacter sp. F2691]|nr:hypothetical protein [Gelidibacter sp. F2691]